MRSPYVAPRQGSVRPRSGLGHNPVITRTCVAPGHRVRVRSRGARRAAAREVTMKYRQLGSSGLRVSELCLGAMTFGEADATSFMHGIGADQETSFAIMNRALEGGCNFFDTADVYGQDGLSERVIG